MKSKFGRIDSQLKTETNENEEGKDLINLGPSAIGTSTKSPRYSSLLS